MIKGYCDDRFLKIKNIFSNQINNGYELGCSVAVEYKGKEVINLYGGYTDETKTNLWKKNTLVNVWSVTKAITGVCIAKLISEMWRPLWSDTTEPSATALSIHKK